MRTQLLLRAKQAPTKLEAPPLGVCGPPPAPRSVGSRGPLPAVTPPATCARTKKETTTDVGETWRALIWQQLLYNVRKHQDTLTPKQMR